MKCRILVAAGDHLRDATQVQCVICEVNVGIVIHIHVKQSHVDDSMNIIMNKTI